MMRLRTEEPKSLVTNSGILRRTSNKAQVVKAVIGPISETRLGEEAQNAN